MAVNPVESNENRHSLFIGQSGSGKTYTMANHPWVTRRGARVIVWDPYESHRATYFSSQRGFARALAGALKSGKGFRIGLSVQPTQAAFEFWARCYWASLDGTKTTIGLVEELADVAQPGKALPAWGQCIRVGRKFGAVIMAATQRPQEIDKTLFTQASRKWCGYVAAYDQPYCERHVGLERGALATIEPETYEYFYIHGPNITRGGPKKPIKNP